MRIPPNVSRGEAANAFYIISGDIEARDAFLTALRDLENHLKARDFDVREEVTGPICDKLFEQVDIISKTVADGTIINARYTSKIIRDFLMAGPNPEFVWEPQTTRALLYFSKYAKNVIIGGAYIGDQALLIARKIGKSGVVHAFEPSSKSVELLEMNVKANNLLNLRVHHAGLWSSETKLELIGFDSHASSDVASDEGESIEAKTLDGYCNSEGIPTLDLIQLDVEGGELEILKGGLGLLSQPEDSAPRLVFEVHSSYLDWSSGLDKTDIIQFLSDLGYQSFAIRDHHGNDEKLTSSIVEIIPPEYCYLEGPPHGFNMLAIKNLDVLECGQFKIVRGVSPKLLSHRDPTYHAPTV